MRTLCPRMHPPDVSMCMPMACTCPHVHAQRCQCSLSFWAAVWAGRVVLGIGGGLTPMSAFCALVVVESPPRRAGVLNWTGLDYATAAHPATAHSRLHRRTGGVTGRHGASAGGAGRAGLYGLYPRNLMVGVSPASPSCISGGPIFWGQIFLQRLRHQRNFSLRRCCGWWGVRPGIIFWQKFSFFIFF